MDKKLILSVDLRGGGQRLIVINAKRRAELAEWLTTCMETNRLAVFKGDDGEIHAAIRGPDISGFGFETIPASLTNNAADELTQLQIQRLRLEIRELESKNSGDSWKNGF